jgi:hypothetical protein
MKCKEPSSIQKFTRKRNWAKFQVTSIKHQAISLMNNESISRGEFLLLDAIMFDANIILKHWKEI